MREVSVSYRTFLDDENSLAAEASTLKATPWYQVRSCNNFMSDQVLFALFLNFEKPLVLPLIFL
jgi:hypothetical protein